jgi:hypothetical protein
MECVLDQPQRVERHGVLNVPYAGPDTIAAPEDGRAPFSTGGFRIRASQKPPKFFRWLSREIPFAVAPLKLKPFGVQGVVGNHKRFPIVIR